MVRVLIGTPTFEYHAHCVCEFASALSAQVEQRFDLILVDNSTAPHHLRALRQLNLPAIRGAWHPRMRERMTLARNLIRQLLLFGDYTHLLFLDQDVILAPYGLAQLLSQGLPIVSGVYCKWYKAEPYAMVILPRERRLDSEVLVTPLSSLNDEGIVEVEGAGFGCLLIEREVCEQLTFRYDRATSRDADLLFCADARELGYGIYCDVGVRCVHRYVVRDFERHPGWGRW